VQHDKQTDTQTDTTNLSLNCTNKQNTKWKILRGFVENYLQACETWQTDRWTNRHNKFELYFTYGLQKLTFLISCKILRKTDRQNTKWNTVKKMLKITYKHDKQKDGQKDTTKMS
jgi:hypothetical protein